MTLGISIYIFFGRYWLKGLKALFQVALQEKMAKPNSQQYTEKLCRIKYALDINVYTFKN